MRRFLLAVLTATTLLAPLTVAAEVETLDPVVVTATRVPTVSRLVITSSPEECASRHGESPGSPDSARSDHVRPLSRDVAVHM